MPWKKFFLDSKLFLTATSWFRDGSSMTGANLWLQFHLPPTICIPATLNIVLFFVPKMSFSRCPSDLKAQPCLGQSSALYPPAWLIILSREPQCFGGTSRPTLIECRSSLVSSQALPLVYNAKEVKCQASTP